MGKAARAAAVLRDEGPRIFALKLASECGYRRLILLERSLTDPIPDIALGRPVDFGVLPPARIAEYFAFRPETAREGIDERLRRGCDCFVARQDGCIAAACWLAMRDATTDYLQCAIELPPGAAYLFDAFTAPAYRGHGIARALCMEQLRHLVRAGFRLAVRATALQNVVAQRMHFSCGFRPVGTMTRVRLGPWQTIRHRRFDGERGIGTMALR